MNFLIKFKIDKEFWIKKSILFKKNNFNFNTFIRKMRNFTKKYSNSIKSLTKKEPALKIQLNSK